MTQACISSSSRILSVLPPSFCTVLSSVLIGHYPALMSHHVVRCPRWGLDTYHKVRVHFAFYATLSTLGTWSINADDLSLVYTPSAVAAPFTLHDHRLPFHFPLPTQPSFDSAMELDVARDNGDAQVVRRLLCSTFTRGCQRLAEKSESLRKILPGMCYK
ncbi:hypothetical protein OH76DRAFT_652585 [Lentinus brumalis]|uniref:Uncharacterized protein n=1 Tax=Lentinus brumalis TaxID=2498619 RepID=A0A371CH84_9APHY|nr:hypothetical protein OH76DRAFT_652585 [Polyporus brumalis]